MTHNRKLVLSGISLTKVKIPAKLNSAAANKARDEVELEAVNSGFFDNAPFKWVGLIIRYGLVDETEPHFNKINQRYGDLPLAIEVNANRFIDATEKDMVAVYRKAALVSLSCAGKKYSLNTKRIDELLEIQMS